MKKTAILFVLPTLIWGSTWFVIKFQLGEIDPLVSVVYRFLLASCLMFLYCFFTKANLSFSPKDHFFMLLQGICLFGLNYWGAYQAELYITSGMMAVVFSCLVFYNSFFSRIFLRTKIDLKVVIGAVLALVGTAFIFSSELIQAQFSDTVITGLAIGFLSLTSASLGQIVSARNSKKEIPVIQSNAFGMLYGSLMMLVLSLALGKELTFNFTTEYVLSLAYLSVFGSVVAFGTFLTLVAKIGPSKASYCLVSIPVISIAISSVFENYHVTLLTILGTILILIGNVLALRKG